MISSAELVRRIIAAPAPVLLPDTCSLLDLLRDPTRDSFSSDQVGAALRLLNNAETRPRTLWIPIASQVMDERADHQMNVKLDAETKIRKLEEVVHRVQKIMAVHGLLTTAITPTLAGSNFPGTASRIVDRYISAGFQVSNPRGVEKKAYARIAANEAPAQKGQQAKDCIVIETYLHIGRQLRDQGFGQTIVFLTTNTKDYSERAGSGALHPDLLAEFSAANMMYAVNFEMAEYLITRV